VNGDQQDGAERVRWAWVIGCVVGGMVFIGVALRGQSLGTWQGVTPSIVVNLDTDFLLAGVLFLLERRFTSRVVLAGQRAVQEAAEQVEGRLKQRTDELSAADRGSSDAGRAENAGPCRGAGPQDRRSRR
jgi:hypothetical protein